MSDRSNIEWTDASWNPIRARNKVTGRVGHFCEKLSAGCKHCYAARMQKRFGNDIQFGAGDRDKVELYLDEKVLLQPLKWKKPRMIFVCSMTDLFGEWVQQEWIDRIWAVMALCPQHTFQVLTKRTEGMANYLTRSSSTTHLSRGKYTRTLRTTEEVTRLANDITDKHIRPLEDWLYHNIHELGGWPLPNVWLGTSVENQATADERIPHLLKCPAVVRWLSVEPMLGAVNLKHVYMIGGGAAVSVNPLTGGRNNSNGMRVLMGGPTTYPKIHWVVCGGESGPSSRPMHPEWARSLRDQCKEAGVAFFFKQWGRYAPGTALDFEQNIVVLKNGEVMPYSNPDWRIAAAKYAESEWGENKPTVMHTPFKNKKHRAELDGVVHQEWPAVATKTQPA